MSDLTDDQPKLVKGTFVFTRQPRFGPSDVFGNASVVGSEVRLVLTRQVGSNFHELTLSFYDDEPFGRALLGFEERGG